MWRKEIGFVVFLTFFFTAAFSFVQGNLILMKADGAERIAAKAARERVIEGQAMLVCAYSSDERFNKMRLHGALPLSAFEKKLVAVDKGQMIIFYCA
jgi:hypothetical protein